MTTVNAFFLFEIFNWFSMIEKQSRALSTFLTFIMWVLIAVFIIYPILRYIYLRIRTWICVTFTLNNGKNCKDAWMTVGRGFAWPFIPSWRVKKPDFVLYSKGVTYVVKQHSFYSRRKMIIFTSPERWRFTIKSRRRKHEKLLTINGLDKDQRPKKTKPAPFYMIRYAQELAKVLNVPCVPVILHTPSVKHLRTRTGVTMSNGDYTFYGMVITDNANLAKTALPKDENYVIPPIPPRERKATIAKIKKVINENLR